ncbi:uncharacterized protein A4U43_C01F25240 [Asparagus officinalis]|uniref:Uncharacterized protein n=1 Tax=Asparagus officinalis TaxID=4686 RepID=A0A5P1FS12_ASPOF|nr:uncharacterized protein A4U43_C01F25240 [Asparagus officinalis]
MALVTYEDYDFTLDVPELDYSLLTELLEEWNGEEIESGDSIDHDCEHCQDCGLDDILSDLGSHECSIPPGMDMIAFEEPLELMELEIASSQDMGGWYITEGGMYFEEQRYDVECLQELLAEQVHIPLWQ